MRRVKWVCFANSLAATCLLAACSPHDASLTYITHADLAVERLNARPFPPSPDVVPEHLVWYPVSLPYVETHRDKLGPANSGNARIWLRLRTATLLPLAAGPQALTYSAHLASGARAVLYVDGASFAATEDFLSNGWNQPVLLALPLNANVPRKPAVLILSFDCYVGVLGCGVPAAMVGSLASARSWYETQQFWRIDAPRIGSVAMLIIGCLALLFWFTRKHESAYLLFAIAAALSTFRTLHYHLSHYPQPEAWFWWLTVSSLTWQCVVVYQFAWRLQNQRRLRMEWILIVIAALLTLGDLPLRATSGWIWEQVVYAVQALVSLLVTTLLTITAVRIRTRAHLALATALWINFAFGIHDFLLETWQLQIDGMFWLPYGAVPLFGAFIYGLARRYREAIDSAESLNLSLESRLAERQTQLQLSYDKLHNYEAEQARSLERQRLIREMHDGIGSTLIASLALIEREQVGQQAIANLLREAVDELRLTIDSLEPVAGDLITLLANLRYRLGPRLERLGLDVDWRMAEVPELPWLDAAAALQILRIVQESITNIIKHAHARRIRIETCVDAELRIVIADDGVGFPAAPHVSAYAGRGLGHIRHRAAQIGANVDIRSGPSGTAVTLRLPLVR